MRHSRVHARKVASMCAEAASICAKAACMCANVASICAKLASMCAKVASMCAKSEVEQEIGFDRCKGQHVIRELVAFSGRYEAENLPF